jgi:hypothetical protein
MNKSDRERYLEALINPQTVTDWEMAAWDKRSPYNQVYTEMLIEGAALNEILETLILRRDILFAQETSRHEQSVKDMHEEEAVRLLHAQMFNVRPPTPRPAPTGKDYVLEAAMAVLEKRLNILREEIPGLELEIKTYKNELSEIDSSWNKRQDVAAKEYIEKLDDKLAEIGIHLPKALDDNDKMALQVAYKGVSPAKILAVNPGLATNPDLNVEGIQKGGDVFRQLRVCLEVNNIINKLKGAPKDACVSPKQIKKLAKLLVDLHTAKDVADIEKIMDPARALGVAQTRLSFIHAEEKLFNQCRDGLYAKPAASEVSVDEPKSNPRRPA